jgi:hypothetical protein
MRAHFLINQLCEEDGPSANAAYAEEGERLAKDLRALGHKASSNWKPEDLTRSDMTLSVVILPGGEGSGYKTGLTFSVSRFRDRRTQVMMFDEQFTIVSRKAVSENPTASEVDRAVEELYTEVKMKQQDIADEIRSEL